MNMYQLISIIILSLCTILPNAAALPQAKPVVGFVKFGFDSFGRQVWLNTANGQQFLETSAGLHQIPVAKAQNVQFHAIHACPPAIYPYKPCPRERGRRGGKAVNKRKSNANASSSPFGGVIIPVDQKNRSNQGYSSYSTSPNDRLMRLVRNRMRGPSIKALDLIKILDDFEQNNITHYEQVLLWLKDSGQMRPVICTNEFINSSHFEYLMWNEKKMRDKYVRHNVVIKDEDDMPSLCESPFSESPPPNQNLSDFNFSQPVFYELNDTGTDRAY